MFLERILRTRPSVEIVATATNGVEAVDAVREHRPDLVFLDIEMPDMNGIEALTIIRSEYPEIAVLMVSAVTDAGRTMQALRLGAIDFIPKPDAKEAEATLK